MSDPVIVALIVSVPPTLVGFATLLATLRNGQKTDAVHVSINSRMDQLLLAENAKGRQDERNAQEMK